MSIMVEGARIVLGKVYCLLQAIQGLSHLQWNTITLSQTLVDWKCAQVDMSSDFPMGHGKFHVQMQISHHHN